LLLPVASAQRLMENLGRGVIAMRSTETEVYVGWRLLGTDPSGVAFNLYRSTGGGKAVKVNSTPLTKTTDFVDSAADFAKSNAYTVRPVIGGKEQAASKAFTLAANAAVGQYLAIPIQQPPGGTAVDGRPYIYNANDASVGDLDGDGEYEIVLKWDPSNSRDNSQAGYTASTIFDAYRMDGRRLWRIDLGRNVRSGAHYTQFLVYDFDGDGKAEIAIRTSDGTIDGTGKVLGDGKADWVSKIAGPTLGKVVAGPEFLTIFDGMTGAAMSSQKFVPDRGDISKWGGVGGNCGNDATGNRVDRFLAGVAYLDGKRPSLVFTRGYYGRTVLAAWDWRNKELTNRWTFDSSLPGLEGYSGQGYHSLSIADVDGDGKDEIVFGSMVIGSDGKGRFSTGFRHGDALHVSRFDPANPDTLVFGIHENNGVGCPSSPGKALYNGRTGEVIWRKDEGVDIGRGLAADIDPRYPGAEFWGGPGGLFNGKGETIGPAPRTTNFAVWWDADPLRELLDDNWIAKWDWLTGTMKRLLTADGCVSNNGSKSTPALSADLFGDWREEVMWRTADNRFLRIYSTTIPATNRIYTLMHDPQYRLAVAWQNVGYNQPPHPSFFIGDGMKEPPAPNITTKLAK
ncbi:MAG: repeat protein, partial [Candidatus Solibacter sp.]|nr:repeat protein [Candidatus Solibacter sp.]